MFSPFNKPPAEVTAADLGRLREVAEGLFVEYKRDLVSGAALAKSVSAFANHDGGWLFLGVEEVRNAEGASVAGAFPGVPAENLSAVRDAIRDGVHANCSPGPPYQVHVFRGPQEDIGLPVDRAVVLVHVEQGFETPYVHKSGRIFRRRADVSEPHPENDPTILQRLADRKEAVRLRLERLFEQTPGLSKYEAEHASMVHVFLSPSPVGDLGRTSKVEWERASQIMASALPEHGGFLLDNIYPLGGGFFGRQIALNEPDGAVASLRYNADCTAVLTLPLSSCRFGDLSGLKEFLLGYLHADAFVAELGRRRFRTGTVIDMNFLLLGIGALCQKYRSLLAEDGIAGELSYKIRLDNCWRRIAFLDLSGYVSSVAQVGLPLLPDSEVWAPIDADPFRLGTLPVDLPELEPGMTPGTVQSTRDAGRTLAWLAPAVGVPLPALTSSIDQVQPAVERAIEVAQRRSATANRPEAGRGRTGR